jgi:putative spermidine/putrescine transport system permease protein
MEQGDRRIATTGVRRPGVLGLPWLAFPALLFLLAFFVLPLLQNLSISFTEAAARTDYIKLLTDPYYLRVIAVTLLLSLGVTAICLLAGYPVAYYMVRSSGRWSGVLVFLLITPLLTPIIMRSFGWQVLLSRAGVLNAMLQGLGWISRPLMLLNGPFAGVIGLVHVQIPFMVLSIAAVLQGINPGLEDAARVLGARPWSVFFRITFPLSLDGVATGCILVFMLTNGSFVTLLLLGGGSLQTLPLLVFQQFNTTQDYVMGAVMSNLLLALALVCLFLQLRLIRRQGITA